VCHAYKSKVLPEKTFARMGGWVGRGMGEGWAVSEEWADRWADGFMKLMK
jgi:hypothetical protein